MTHGGDDPKRGNTCTRARTREARTVGGETSGKEAAEWQKTCDDSEPRGSTKHHPRTPRWRPPHRLAQRNVLLSDELSGFMVQTPTPP
jgi:hypothetical protein